MIQVIFENVLSHLLNPYKSRETGDFLKWMANDVTFWRRGDRMTRIIFGAVQRSSVACYGKKIRYASHILETDRYLSMWVTLPLNPQLIKSNRYMR